MKSQIDLTLLKVDFDLNDGIFSVLDGEFHIMERIPDTDDYITVLTLKLDRPVEINIESGKTHISHHCLTKSDFTTLSVTGNLQRVSLSGSKNKLYARLYLREGVINV